MTTSEPLDVVPEGVLATFGVAGVVLVPLPGGQGWTGWQWVSGL